jgi:hypothetical protein
MTLGDVPVGRCCYLRCGCEYYILGTNTWESDTILVQRMPIRLPDGTIAQAPYCRECHMPKPDKGLGSTNEIWFPRTTPVVDQFQLILTNSFK